MKANRTRARCATVVFLATAFLGLAVPSARAELVDHIVAAVNNEVITASELAQAVALNRRFGKPGEGASALEQSTLQGLITRRLLVQEAQRLRFVEVTDEETAAAVKRFADLFASRTAYSDFLADNDLTEAELARMLGEQLLVKRFVEKKVGLFVRVSRTDAEEWFRTHPREYAGKRFVDVQKSITDFLQDRAVQTQLDQYVAELRAKADIRINPPLRSASGR